MPQELYHTEWERRRLRNRVHLTIGGCLGPCALANVAMLLVGGRTLWFHSINDPSLVLNLYDYAERLLDSDGYVPPPPRLAAHQFTASTCEDRPDGQPVYDAQQTTRPAVGPPAGCTAFRPPQARVSVLYPRGMSPSAPDSPRRSLRRAAVSGPSDCRAARRGQQALDPRGGAATGMAILRRSPRAASPRPAPAAARTHGRSRMPAAPPAAHPR